MQPSLFYYWQKQLFENAPLAFEKEKRSSREKELAAENAALKARLAEKEATIARKDGVAGPCPRDAVMIRSVAQRLRLTSGWQRGQLQLTRHAQVPQGQPDERREPLTREVVDDDAVQAQFAVLVHEAILLGDAAEPGCDGLGGRPGVSGRIQRERLYLPPLSAGVESLHHRMTQYLVDPTDSRQ